MATAVCIHQEPGQTDYRVNDGGKHTCVQFLSRPGDVRYLGPDARWEVNLIAEDTTTHGIGGSGRTREEAFDAATKQYDAAADKREFPPHDWKAARVALAKVGAFK